MSLNMAAGRDKVIHPGERNRLNEYMRHDQDISHENLRSSRDYICILVRRKKYVIHLGTHALAAELEVQIVCPAGSPLPN
ncbi:uncharacterized protein N7515_005660 [Penicillium bovifimosum]|uniref:Uncharacterized protein n=1 Tax=Penicillium bovifimosum TaxID=126998 RepID=A0A9W9L015_9EURO|nr:uncharacterized protein N7515_005660 [Penicillium bovifimosum]KAJ5129621.1 hypothetical protein N7515_005660 [Penicillium bovifimosum]